ncbi:MAG: HD domain-containing phosphohydrolase, partial [Candidatus Dormiibacterota bacterium]
RSNLQSEQLEDLRTAAFLHDVGHMTMPNGAQSLESPGHAEEGEKIVADANFSDQVVAAVRHHPERWDGVGQAGGTAGENITLLARILAVTERFEALTAGRGCARVTSQEALDKMLEGSGTEFDPAVVETLGKAVHDGGLELNLPDVALPAAPAAD